MQAVAFAPVIAGLGAHILCQYHPPATLSGIAILLFAAPIGCGLLSTWNGLYGGTISSIFASAFIYIGSLVTSVIVYCLSPLHPLAKYPGPIICRITRLWALWKVLEGRQHLYYHELHERYGDVVRTGPDHLHIRNVDAIPVVLGAGNEDTQWTRAGRVEATKLHGTTGSVFSIVSPTEHSKRRRVWNRAFTPAALKEYEVMIYRRVAQLVQGLEDRKGQVIDLCSWANYFTMDFMGDIAFDSTFNFLVQGHDDIGLHHIIEEGARIQEALGTIPWIRPIYLAMPKPRAHGKLREAGLFHITKRKGGGTSKKDIFFYLLGEDGPTDHEPLSIPTLILESVLVLVAGSDTTAVAISSIFYFLLSHPDIFDRVRRELADSIPRDAEQPEISLLAELPLLQAVINESLRLLPPVPNGPTRKPPPRGGDVLIGDIVVPRDTTVQIPTWSVQRDPRYFWPHPNKFDPGRWLVNPKDVSTDDFRLNTSAWMPFIHGPTNCVGKQLATNEIRIVVSALIRNFNIEVAPGYDLSKWEHELKDKFVLARGKLPIIVSPKEA